MNRSAFDLIRSLRFEVARDLPALALAALTIGLGMLGEGGRELLSFQRQSILQGGEWWRLASGHFVHLGWSHLWLNLGGCLLVWFLFRRDYLLIQWFLIVVASLAAMDLGFLVLHPSLEWYVGLSGLLHGLFAAGMLQWLREGNWESWVMLAIFGAKLAWEQAAGPLPLTTESAGGPVIVDAHLYGAVGGAVAGLSMIAASVHRARV